MKIIMKGFDIMSKKEQKEIIAPVGGITVELEDTPDPAFAEKLVGDGVAVEPSEGVFRSPCDGEITGVAQALHAYSITSNDGLEILVHIGIDTVELKGKGFSPRVKPGDKVKKGDIITEADIDMIRRSGYSAVTPVVISNIDEIASWNKKKGKVKGGVDGIISYTL